MRFRIFFVTAILAWQIAAFAGQDNPEITIPELREHITFLASDSLKGRKPGTKECRIAAQYIKDQLPANMDFSLVKNGLQNFEVVSSIEAGANNQFSFSRITGELGKSFTPVAFSKNTTLRASVVFVGYGFDFDSDSVSWHDYNGVDVSGKWALILRGDPEIDKPNSIFASFSSMRNKTLKAKDKGAAGVIFVSGVKFDKKDKLVKLTFDKSQATAGIPVLQIKRSLADSILKRTGQTIETLEQNLNERRKPESFSIDEKVSATTDVVKKMAKTQNVLAFLPGTDPVLKNEFIVLGAHYDHLGFGGPGSGSRRPDTLAIHNGADDNASGVAAILEVMEKLADEKPKIKRSILFISFSAEEMGLLGSNYFVNHPPLDLKQIKFMFNVDMVGRLDPQTQKLNIGGTGTAVGLNEIVKRDAAADSLNVNLSTAGYGPSDQASFYAKDIPVLYFYTNAHEDYHTPDDDVQFINFNGVKRTAELVYDLIVDIANRPQALAFQEAGPKERRRGRRQYKVTLGIMPDFSGSGSNGLRVDGIVKGRPADLAGMQKGDVIVSMDGKPVTNIYDYMYRLNEFEPGQRISVKVLRSGKKVILIVDL